MVTFALTDSFHLFQLLFGKQLLDYYKNEALRQFNNGKDKRKEDSYI